MESKLAKQAHQSLLQAMRQLTPEERLNAFLTHCRLMMDLYQAGRQMRAMHSQSNANPSTSICCDDLPRGTDAPRWLR